MLPPLCWYLYCEAFDFGRGYGGVWLHANKNLMLPHYCIFLLITKIFYIIGPCSLCVSLRNIYVQGFQLA
jgi:hypothetical protein